MNKYVVLGWKARLVYLHDGRCIPISVVWLYFLVCRKIVTLELWYHHH